MRTNTKQAKMGASAVMARILAAENINVVIDSKAQTASMDTQSRVLTLPLFDPEKTSEVVVDGLIIHECGHALFTPDVVTPPKDTILLEGYIQMMKNAGLPYPKSVDACRRSLAGLGSFYQSLFMIYNIVEDSRIERMISKKYAGAGNILGAMYRTLANNTEIEQFKHLRQMLTAEYMEKACLPDRINVSVKFPMIPFKMEQWERNLLSMVETTQTFEDVIRVSVEIAKHMEFPPFNYDSNSDNNSQGVPSGWMNPEDFENMPENSKSSSQSNSSENSKDSKSKNNSSGKSKNSKDSAGSEDDSEDSTGAGDSEGAEDAEDESDGSEGAEDSTGAEDSEGSEDSEDGAGGSEGAEDSTGAGDSEGGSDGSDNDSDADDANASSLNSSDEEDFTRGASKGEGSLPKSKYNENNKISKALEDISKKSVRKPMRDYYNNTARVLSLPKFDGKQIEASIYDFTEIMSFSPTDIIDKDNKTSIKKISMVNAFARRMLSRFDRDKAAKIFANTQTARTGRLDMLKLAMYRTNDDVFLRSQVEKTGKNHGVIILLDWSGSMANVEKDVLFQAAVYAKFCALANIPYEIYLFTSGSLKVYNLSSKTSLDNSTNKRDIIPCNARMVNIFSSRMTTRQLDDMFHFVLSSQYSRNRLFTMGGTPLDDALIMLFSIAIQKQTQWKIDVGNMIVISDGNGDGMICGNLINPMNPLQTIYMNGYSGQINYVGTNTTVKLVQLFKKYTRWNTMSIYISSSRSNVSNFRNNFMAYGNKVDTGPANDYASSRAPNYAGYDKSFIVTRDYLRNNNRGCFFELLAGDIAQHIIDDINNDWEHA